MNAQNDNTAPNGLPPRSGMRRIIPRFEYRHLRGFGVARVAGSCVQAAAGLICLSYGVYGWAAFFLVIAALSLASGSWYLTIAGSATPRT